MALPNWKCESTRTIRSLPKSATKMSQLTSHARPRGSLSIVAGSGRASRPASARPGAERVFIDPDEAGRQEGETSYRVVPPFRNTGRRRAWNESKASGRPPR